MSDDTPHLSPSQINTYLRCPMQHYFSYQRGIKIPPSGALVRGKALHYAAEVNYTQKLESHEDLPLADLEEAAASGFEREAASAAFSDDETPGTVLDSTIALTGVYGREVAPQVQPELIEHRFEIAVPGADIPLLGYIDVIDDAGNIRDLKTASKTPPQDAADKSLQLTAYGFARRAVGGEAEQLVLDFTVATKTPKYERRVTTRTEDD